MHPTRQFETAVCGGSNLKAPMKLDFLRSLCAQERHAWPEVVLCRVEGEPLPVCCLSEAAAGDPFARIGIVTAPSEALTALLRTAPVRARVTALCDSAGEPCDGGAPDVWGFLAEYRCGDPLSGAVRAAIDGAAARGCASPEALTARAEYLLEQAVPEPIILRVFAGSRPLYSAAGMAKTGKSRPVKPTMRAPPSCGRSTQTQQAIKQPVTETAS